MSDLWTPLSERETNSAAGLRDGVPTAMEAPLRGWVRHVGHAYSASVERVAVRCDLDLSVEDDEPAVLLAYLPGSERLLDIVDALLDLMPPRPAEWWRPELVGPGVPNPRWEAPVLEDGVLVVPTVKARKFRDPLQHLLDDARSLYTLRSDGRALIQRLDPEVAAAVDAAARAADQPERGSATRHLQQAREAAYALHPDPVKAYSEAIKAVESAAHITLQPKHATATLGTMLGELRQARHKLSVPITGKAGTEGVEMVEKMMELLWTGQTSRHGNLQATRDETVAEATMAVHIAATLVQLFASGALRRS